jgi:hypothetical protein
VQRAEARAFPRFTQYYLGCHVATADLYITLVGAVVTTRRKNLDVDRRCVQLPRYRDGQSSAIAVL